MTADTGQRRSLFGQLWSSFRPGGWPLRSAAALLIVTLMVLGRGSPQLSSSVTFTVTPAQSSALGTATEPDQATRDSQAIGLVDYLQSDEVIAMLAAHDQLVERFRRPEADRFSRLGPNTSNARLADYYRRQVTVRYSANSGRITATVRAFRSRDAMELAGRLLAIASDRVAASNVGRFNAGFKAAQADLAQAEKSLATAEAALRLSAPAASVAGTTPGPGGDALASARSRLAIMARVLSPDSPQYVAMQAYARRLEATAPPPPPEATSPTAAPDDAATRRYEEATKRYEVAAAAFDKTRAQAEGGRSYVVRVAGPTVPRQATYPMQLPRIAAMIAILAGLYGVWRLIGGRRAGPMRGTSPTAGDQPVR